jgi:hypothetical protein
MSEFEASVDAWASALADPGQSTADRDGSRPDVMVRRGSGGSGEAQVEIRIRDPNGEQTVALSPEEARRLAERLAAAAATSEPGGAVEAED